MKVRAWHDDHSSLTLIALVFASDENHHWSCHRYHHCHHSRLHREGHTPLSSGVLVYLYLWILSLCAPPMPTPFTDSWHLDLLYLFAHYT